MQKINLTHTYKNITTPAQKHEEERQCLPVVYKASAAGQQENVILQLSLQKHARQRRHFDLFSLRSMQGRRSASSESLSLLSSQKWCCFGLSSILRPALNTALLSAPVKCILTNVSYKVGVVEQQECRSYTRHTLVCAPGLGFSDAGSKTGRFPTGRLPAINRNIS